MLNQHLTAASPLIEQKPIVDINWQYLLQTRAQVIQASEDLPAYLLMPEITALIESELDMTRQFAFEMMFITGCRVSELLLLTPNHFVLTEPEQGYVNMPTLKRRDNPKGRKRQRLNTKVSLGKLPLRQVPITDPLFIAKVQRYIKTNKLAKNKPFFNVTRRTIARWLKEAVDNYQASHAPFEVNISPHTFRHSYAVNAILHFVPVKILQSWLGHESQKSTEVYAKVLFSDSFEFAKRISWRPTLPYQLYLNSETPSE